MMDMSYREQKLQHEVQMILMEHALDWPDTFMEASQIDLPDGVAWTCDEKSGYYVTNFVSFFVHKVDVEVFYKLETKH